MTLQEDHVEPRHRIPLFTPLGRSVDLPEKEPKLKTSRWTTAAPDRSVRLASRAGESR